MSFWKKSSNNNSAKSLPLVAIDMGSYSLRAIAAEPTGDGRFRILGIESLPYDNRCIERGIITKPSDMAFHIKKVLTFLAHSIGMNELPRTITSWGGRGVTFTDVTIRRALQNRSITKKDLDEWRQECIDKTVTSDKSAFAATPHRFVIDGEQTFQEPQVGDRCKDIRAIYNTFYGPNELKKQVVNTFTASNTIQLENIFLRCEALLSAFSLTDGDNILDEGCAVLDFGAETTTLFIYKGSSYLHYQVFEQGGADITEHLSNRFEIPFRNAEKLKCDRGAAYPDFIENNQTLTITYTNGDKRRITLVEIAQEIEVVLKVLLSPIYKSLLPYEDQITRLYITGGASMLKGLGQYIQSATSLSVQFGSHQDVLVPDSDEDFYLPAYSSLVGMLILGQEQRDLHGANYVEKGLIEKFRNTFTNAAMDIFSGANLTNE